MAWTVTANLAVVAAHTFWETGCVMTSRKFTVSVATALVTDPLLFETTTRSCALLSAAAAVNVQTANLQFRLPQLELDRRCHW